MGRKGYFITLGGHREYARLQGRIPLSGEAWWEWWRVTGVYKGYLLPASLHCLAFSYIYTATFWFLPTGHHMPAMVWLDIPAPYHSHLYHAPYYHYITITTHATYAFTDMPFILMLPVLPSCLPPFSACQACHTMTFCCLAILPGFLIYLPGSSWTFPLLQRGSLPPSGSYGSRNYPDLGTFPMLPLPLGFLWVCSLGLVGPTLPLPSPCSPMPGPRFVVPGCMQCCAMAWVDRQILCHVVEPACWFP